MSLKSLLISCTFACIASPCFAAAIPPEDDPVPDPTFGTAGATSFDIGGNVDDGGFVVIRDNVDYVVLGAQRPAPDTDAFTLTISRLSTAGVLSATFGSGGRLVTNVPGYPREGAFIDAAGRITAVVAGIGVPDRVARFKPDGTLDTTFSGDGLWQAPDGAAIWAIAYADGGGVWVSKQHATGAPDSELIRLTDTGAVDPSFTPLGAAQLAPYAPTLWAPLLRDAQGRLWWASTTLAQSQITGQLVVRLTASGAIDTSYSGDGIAVASTPRCSSALYSMARLVVLDSDIAIALHDESIGGASYASARAFAADGTPGPLRCDDDTGTLFVNSGYAARDGAAFFAGSSNCVTAGCGPALRRYLVQNGVVVDDPAFDVATATHVFPSGGGGAAGILDDQGKPVIVGSVAQATGLNDTAMVRYGGKNLLFRGGFE